MSSLFTQVSHFCIDLTVTGNVSGLHVSSEEIRSSSTWTTSEVNPDYNLAVLYSANIGFQARVRGDRGSDFIWSFIETVKRNIDRNENRKLQDICYEIQDKLHREGRSLPEFTFNNATRHVVLQKKVSSPNF